MIRKYIQHIAIVGLKYFFDLDYTTYAHSFAMFFVAFGFIRLGYYWVADELHDGIQTVKYDYVTVKQKMGQLAGRLELNADNSIMSQLRNLKNNISHRNLSA